MKNIEKYKSFTLGLIVGILLIGGGAYAATTQSGTIGSLFTDIGGGTYRLVGDYIKDGTVGNDELGISSVTSGKIYDGTIIDADVDTSKIQRRISGSCLAEEFIQEINEDGSVTCLSGADEYLLKDAEEYNIGTKWKIILNGDNLEFQFNGDSKIIFTESGEIIANQYNLN